MTALFTAREVQDLLDVDKSTVYRMASDGRLPAVKVGRQWRFPAEAIRRLLVVAAAPAASGRAEARLAPAGLDPAVAQAVIDLTAEALGVMLVVTDAHGSPVTNVANPCARFLELARRPDAVAECAEEWRELAADADTSPVFRPGRHGFLCARSFVRADDRTVGMVLAGGVAPDHAPADDLHVLDRDGRRRVVAALPKLAALLSQVAVTRSPSPSRSTA